jgi:predicted small lipoprotein YifL
MKFLHGRACCRVLALGTLALALGLASCGRKGPLEPPPSAAIEPAPTVAPTVAPTPPGTAWAETVPGAPATGRPPGAPNQAVTAGAPAGKQQSILDLLLN